MTDALSASRLEAARIFLMDLAKRGGGRLDLLSPTVRYEVLGNNSLSGVYSGRDAVGEHLRRLVDQTGDTYDTLRWEDWMVGEHHIAALVSVHVQVPGKALEGRILFLVKFSVGDDLIAELTVFFENERAIDRFFLVREPGLHVVCDRLHQRKALDRLMTSTDASVWPDLTLSLWQDTSDTLLLWTQIVGKIRMALEPMINHWWQVPLYLSSRGLTTSLMHADKRGLEIEFDFIKHVLSLQTTDDRRVRIALEPRSVADFYQATMTAMEELGIRIRIVARPVEMAIAIPFPQDEEHRSYDWKAAHRYWSALVQMERVMTMFRARYLGKVSPVHFFWGAGDLAVSRFSGRPAPKHRGSVPNCPDWVQEMAYSHEVSSCGFWPGGSAEGSFYAYVYPQPPGFADWPVAPSAAYFDESFGEFLLPYESVRMADDPDALLLEFFQNTYEAAAELAHWDRAALEVSF